MGWARKRTDVDSGAKSLQITVSPDAGRQGDNHVAAQHTCRPHATSRRRNRRRQASTIAIKVFDSGSIARCAIEEPA